jgi:MATE family multidrug resistance protein
MMPALMVMALKSYLAALGRTQVVLWVTLGSVGLNVAMNWMFIFGNWGAPELGVVGAALATLAVQVASVLCLGLYAGWLPELRRFRLWQRFWRADWVAFGRVFRLGWPIGVTGLMESGLFQASALMMGWIGTVELAAHGIAMEVAALAFMVHLGLSNAVTIRTAHADGSGDLPGMRAGGIAGIALSMGFGVAMVGLFLAFPAPIIALFLDMAKPESAQIVAFGTVLLALAALFQLADAMQVIALGLLRGVQDTRVPMWLAAVSYWGVGIPCSYVLAFVMGWGAVGVWLGLVVGLVIAAASLMWRFWSGIGRRSALAGSREEVAG